MDRKASLDLSMNMLVIIIISIFILMLGVAFLFKSYTLVGPHPSPYQELDQQIQLLLIDQSKQVALIPQVATIQAGNSHSLALAF